MLGLGFGELLVIGVLVLFAVGPDRLPTFMRSVGRAMREFKKASNELRAQVGDDELMRDDDLRNPMRPAPKTRPLPRTDLAASAPRPSDSDSPTHPSQGVDIAEARLRGRPKA